MAKTVFSLYINLQDKNLNLDILKNKKFIISLCPASLNNLTEKDIKQIKEFLKSGCILGQRGNLGICKYKHELTEPWHENSCLHNPSISFEEQLSFMKKGKETLTKIFREPQVYCPVNHLYDINTIKAAQILKYQYMMDLNLQNLEFYKLDGLILIPEKKLDKEKNEKIKTCAVYTHYEGLRRKEISEFIKKNEFILPDKVKIGKNKQEDIVANEIKKKIRKLEKDLKKLEGCE
jgi:hypothetical protein